MGLKILITGANGYIGSSLTRALKDRYNVFAVTRSQADLTNSWEVKRLFKIDYDAVIHCAGQGGSRLKLDDTSVLDNNLRSYYNLLEYKNFYKKFINIGSGAEIHSPNTYYGLSKRVIGESVVYNGFTNIRVYGVFDENELETRFIKAGILKHKKGERIVIHGNRLFDFFYMKDLVKLVEYSLTNKVVLANAVYEEKRTLANIALLIGDNNPLFEEPYLDSYGYTGMYSDLGIKFIGLEEGIKEVYGYV